MVQRKRYSAIESYSSSCVPALPIAGVPSMTADNFDRGLQALLDIQPFHVFTVELHGGRRFEVDHARAIVVRDGVAVFLAPGGVPIWFDHESVNQIIGASRRRSPNGRKSS
jgi:hypothetical protein